MNNNPHQTPIKYNKNTRNYSNSNGTHAKTYDRSFHHISKIPYTILDIEKNTKKKIIIDSPRSIIALKQCGISVDELYYISFKEFIQQNDALRNVSKETQVSQYEFFDKHRKDKLAEVVKARADLIQSELKDNNNENDMSIYNNKTLSNMHTVSNYRKSKTPFNLSKSCSDLGCTTTLSSVMNTQLKKYNQLKTKNEIELINLIENEIKKEQMKHKEQQVMLSQQEKAYQHQHNKMLRSQEHYIKKQRRQSEKRRKELTDQKIFAKLEIERHNKEQDKLKKDKEDEQMRFKAMKLKHKEEEQKRQAFHIKQEQRQEDFRIQMMTKQKEMEDKEKERQEHLQQERQIKHKHKLKLSQEKKAQIEKSKQDFEMKLNQKRNQFMDKQKQNEINKQQLNGIKYMNILKQHDEYKRKSQIRQQILERNQMIYENKVDNYLKKQEQLSYRKTMLAKQNDKELKHKKNKSAEKQINNHKLIQLNEDIRNQHRDALLKEMNEKEQKVLKMKQQQQKEKEHKKEEQFKKDLIMNDNIKHIACKQQYKQEQLRQYLLDKEEKIALLKLQKQAIANEKTKIQHNMSIKQDNVNQQFQRFLNKKHLDYDVVSQMNELFTNNNKFEMLLQKLKEQQYNEWSNNNKSCSVKDNDKSINSYRHHHRNHSAVDVKHSNHTVNYTLNQSDNLGECVMNKNNYSERGNESEKKISDCNNNVDNVGVNGKMSNDNGNANLNEDIKQKVDECKHKLSNELKSFIEEEEKKQKVITNQINESNE